MTGFQISQQTTTKWDQTLQERALVQTFLHNQFLAKVLYSSKKDKG